MEPVRGSAGTDSTGSRPEVEAPFMRLASTLACAAAVSLTACGENAVSMVFHLTVTRADAPSAR